MYVTESNDFSRLSQVSQNGAGAALLEVLLAGTPMNCSRLAKEVSLHS